MKILSASLLALDWETGNNFRSAPLPLPSGGRTGFTLLPAAETGITFTNLLSQDRYTTNQIYLNGSGVAAGDVDGDGWCDLFFCGLGGGSVLYRNLGKWKFQDITASAGVACPNLDATGAVLADIDGDGDLDLIINSVGGGTHIFLNDGKAHFTQAAKLNPDRGAMSLALADIDGDGALDLYIANYRPTTLRDQPRTNFRINIVDGKQVVALVNGEPTTSPALAGRFTLNPRGGISEHGESDALFRNDGTGNFTPVSFTDGTFLDEDGRPLATPPYDWGLSVMFRDLNEDGAPDIYVCNDFDSVDRIWINTGRGKFQAIPRLAIRNTCKFSMGVDVADINRDGHDDLCVLDMLSRQHLTRLTRMDKSMEATPIGVVDYRPQLTRNTLHLNRGDNTYAEIACYSGLEASDWSWTPIFLDVDLDGYEDLLVTTGHGRDDMDIDHVLRIDAAKRANKLPILEELGLRKHTPKLETPKRAFRNLGNLRFEEVGVQWGFNQVGISHGMCLADLDNDGDLDVVVNNLNTAAGIYRNENSAPRVGVRLRGRSPNTQGIGAKIKVLRGAVPMQSQEVICGGRYLSGDDPMRVFAAGTLTNEMRIEVRWRNGRQSVLEGVRANRVYEIAEAGGAAERESVNNSPSLQRSDALALSRSNAPTLFADVSRLIAHEHHEEEFEDFERQRLLPRRLSQMGPGVSWADVNGDGWEDLIIGSGKGGKLAVYQNNGRGGFLRLEQGPLTQAVTRDQTAVLGWQRADGSVMLLAGSANYEDGLAVGSAVRQFDLTKKTIDDSLPGQASSTGPLALGDADGDGDLDLFVGGRVVPGRYPEAATSILFENRQGHWVLDEVNSKVLKAVGMVSGAVWSDLDGDGYPELVLACEWGPVKVFKNEQGRLRDATQAWGLNKYVGWWNGVSAGDFDGDGRMDFIASNWGLNSAYRASEKWPRRLYYADWSGAGVVEMIESYFDLELQQWVPDRDLNTVAKALPWVREKYSSHRAYAQAGVDAILGERLKGAKILEANWLETTVFLNRGDHFERGELPLEAQFSPAFGINVGDVDGDGREDIFLSQNFFAVSPQNSRQDAGRGLWLRGEGNGKFAAMGGEQSGIKVYGEQRGSALGDYDGDGRVDLAVSQNGAATKLYRNVGGRVGLRVRLKGGAGNPTGIGAVMRLGFAGRWGAAREVHAGSGYWSQDSAVQVLATPEPPTQIQIRWPGGKTVTASVSNEAKEIAVDLNGVVEVVR